MTLPDNKIVKGVQEGLIKVRDARRRLVDKVKNNEQLDKVMARLKEKKDRVERKMGKAPF